MPVTTPSPTETNNAATIGVDVVTGIVQTGVKLGEAALFLDFPWLATPGLKQLTELLINWLSGYVVNGLSQVVVFSVIDVQVGHEETTYAKALAQLKAAQAGKDPIAIQKALLEFQKAALDLGHSDGSKPI